jgi:hypothetical protein
VTGQDRDTLRKLSRPERETDTSGRTESKADTGGGFHPATAPTSSAAKELLYSEDSPRDGYVVLPGQRWRSLDPRDEGLEVTVLSVSSGYVTIQRFNKSRVRRDRFTKAYAYVR